ncbi:MAG: hypothetical protein KDB02_05765 [Acidimicrobiales bacterium]|nr:hypothetical protein [Acidimicrobiales bacterium]
MSLQEGDLFGREERARSDVEAAGSCPIDEVARADAELKCKFVEEHLCSEEGI